VLVVGFAVGWDDPVDASVGGARRVVDAGAVTVDVDEAVDDVVRAHPAMRVIARIAVPSLVLRGCVDTGEACSVNVCNV